ncbi:MAG TPA: DUF402 domain-containing protein [Actinomycetes bacterium]|nr:DUF402 domain-containing protein [Actinomycetes bacterium]
MARRPGDQVEVRFTKWGGGAHYEYPLTYLGVDTHGHWGGGRAGTRLAHPGGGFVSAIDWVTLFPDDRPWSASFYDGHENQVSVFVDMTTPPVWDGFRVGLVDLDLDVVLLRDGSLFVDDEDEFAAHQVSLRYPREIVELARRSADDVITEIAAGAEPFATTGHRWLRRLAHTGHDRDVRAQERSRPLS